MREANFFWGVSVNNDGTFTSFNPHEMYLPQNKFDLSICSSRGGFHAVGCQAWELDQLESIGLSVCLQPSYCACPLDKKRDVSIPLGS
jgi:hypothetical protein